MPYRNHARRLMDDFENIILEHIPRKENEQADALANLATSLAKMNIQMMSIAVLQKWVMPPIQNEEEEEEADTVFIHIVEVKDWH